MAGEAQEKIRGAVKNVAFKFISEVGGKILVLLYTIVLTHFLGSELFGRFTFALTLGGMLALSSDLGLSVIASREIARVKDNQIRPLFNRLLFLKLLAFLPIAVAIAALFIFWPPDSNIPVLLPAVFTLSMALFITIDLSASALRARFHSQREAILYLAQRLVLLAVSLSFLLVGGGLLSVGYAHLIASGFGVILGFWLLSPITKSHSYDRTGLPTKRWLLFQTFPIFIASLFIIAYFRVDILLLRFLGIDDAQIGLYGAAYRLIDAIMMLPALLVTGIFPALSFFYSADSAAHLAIFRKSGELLRILAVVGVAIVLLLFPLSAPIVHLAFGKEFLGSSSPLRILLWAVPFIFINYLLYYLIVAMNRQKLNLISTAFCLLFNLTANLLLIPRFGIIASAGITVGTEFLLFILCLIFVFRQVDIPWGKLTMIALGAVVCGGIQMALGNYWGLLALALFAGWSFLTRALTVADISLMLNTLRRRGDLENA
jgi:O-antigen/teichoic acid export membrane protein